MIRLKAGHSSKERDVPPVWSWSSKTGTAPAMWTVPGRHFSAASADAADRRTWILVVAHTPLRRAPPLAADLRRPGRNLPALTGPGPSPPRVQELPHSPRLPDPCSRTHRNRPRATRRQEQPPGVLLRRRRDRRTPARRRSRPSASPVDPGSRRTSRESLFDPWRATAQLRVRTGPSKCGGDRADTRSVSQSRAARRPGSGSEVLTEIISRTARGLRGLASILSGGLRCAAMTTGTALRHTRIGDPALH